MQNVNTAPDLPSPSFEEGQGIRGRQEAGQGKRGWVFAIR